MAYFNLDRSGFKIYSIFYDLDAFALGDHINFEKSTKVVKNVPEGVKILRTITQSPSFWSQILIMGIFDDAQNEMDMLKLPILEKKCLKD